MSPDPNAQAVDEDSLVQDTPREAADSYMAQLREKIVFGLSMYPYLNPTMLHTFLGTSTPVSLWKDQVLAQLIEEGIVVQTNVSRLSPQQRTQTYSVLHLACNPYPSANDTSDGVQPEDNNASTVD
jgi:hypothetical protein